eukprot:125153_1
MLNINESISHLIHRSIIDLYQLRLPDTFQYCFRAISSSIIRHSSFYCRTFTLHFLPPIRLILRHLCSDTFRLSLVVSSLDLFGAMYDLQRECIIHQKSVYLLDCVWSGVYRS